MPQPYLILLLETEWESYLRFFRHKNLVIWRWNLIRLFGLRFIFLLKLYFAVVGRWNVKSLRRPRSALGPWLLAHKLLTESRSSIVFHESFFKVLSHIQVLVSDSHVKRCGLKLLTSLGLLLSVENLNFIHSFLGERAPSQSVGSLMGNIIIFL